MPKLSQVHLNETVARAAKPGDCISDSVDRGFRLVVSASGAKRFVAAYRVGSKGKSSKKTLGHYPTMTVTAARAIARKVLALAKDGIDPQAEEEAARNAPTLANLARVYLEDYALEQALRPATVRHATALLAIATTSLARKIHRGLADVA